MPEDQGQNGDRWTEEASRLLGRLGWEKVADSNIDIEGTDGLQHGIDALFRYEGSLDLSRPEGVFLEAKRYETDSFRPVKLTDWVSKLDEKMLQLRLAQSFQDTYPRMKDTDPRNAVLMIWFPDTARYPALAAKLSEYMANMHIPAKRKAYPNRLYVLHNEGILRLASLVQAVDELKTNLKCTEPDFRFYYLPRQKHGTPACEHPHLSLDYAFSNIIMSRLSFASVPGAPARPIDIAFLYGGYTIPCFQRLRQALALYGMLNSSSTLYVYHRAAADQLRKIQPDVQKLFGKEVKLMPMTSYSDLPPWMQQGEQ